MGLDGDLENAPAFMGDIQVALFVERNTGDGVQRSGLALDRDGVDQRPGLHVVDGELRWLEVARDAEGGGAGDIDRDAFRIAGEWQGRDQTGMAERAVARVEAASSITGESWKFHE